MFIQKRIIKIPHLNMLEVVDKMGNIAEVYFDNFPVIESLIFAFVFVFVFVFVTKVAKNCYFLFQ